MDGQKKKGYTPMPNNFLERALKSGFSLSELEVLFAIARYTYGWHKRSNEVSIGQICEMTDVKRRAVVYALKQLEERKVISVERTPHKANIITIYAPEHWLGSASPCTSANSDMGSASPCTTDSASPCTTYSQTSASPCTTPSAPPCTHKIYKDISKNIFKESNSPSGEEEQKTFYEDNEELPFN